MSKDDQPIAFFDLAAQQKRIRSKIEKRFGDILDHGRYINGPEVAELEEKLIKLTGAADAVAVGSGTQALVMPMIALGYGYGDAVFIPNFTYNATANAVLLAGATPVFVDIDPKTFNMDPKDLEQRIERVRARRDLRPRAIVPVDLYGVPADYVAIDEIAKSYGLQIISDAAQSFGCVHKNKMAGAIAPITGTSFYPTKSLGGYGDGGAILTTEPGFGEMLRSIRWHGTDDKLKNSIRVGINGRCDSIQCAIVSEKMEIFADELKRRREIARLYDDNLPESCVKQTILPDTISAYGLYTIAVDNRAAVRMALSDRGVPSAIYYDMPLHKMPAFEPYAPNRHMQNGEAAAKRVLSLPMHPYLTDNQVMHVCEALSDILD